MSTITVTLKDDSRHTFEKGVRVGDVLQKTEGLTNENLIAARLDGKPTDLSTVLTRDVRLEPITADSADGLEILRHSTAHVMAQAVKTLFNNVKIGIGPAIEDGFYYDFDYNGVFSPEDFSVIEKKMHEIIEADLPFDRETTSKEEAVRLFQELREPYKLELLAEIPDEEVTLYRQGDFVDLCRGPHVTSTKQIKAFKLTKVAGAYWRGDESNKMLQRIYGTAFFDQEALYRYLNQLEEAKKRDHRRLGRVLDLFSVSDEVGAGMIIFHPKGAILRTIIEDFERREHLKRGYQIVSGPQILKRELWERSGHFDNYKENMYFTQIDGQDYGIKPMNCLAHMLIYKSKIRSYRDLPIRYFELGTVHRHERSGVLHGLFRVRQFTQDDAHIICTPEQLDDEIKGVINFVAEVMDMFGFDYDLELSTRPKKSIGTDDDWKRATNALMAALEDYGRAYGINEGEGAFYGPKIDVKLRDALNRQWQCATIQCDFTLPERFDLTYIGPDGTKHRPVMLHRVILGAIERFLGILIEHYGGAFPTWLSPVQAIILTVTERHNAYAGEVFDRLLDAEIRVEKDIRNEKLGLKIREAQMQKIPYMLVIGDKEVSAKGLSPRKRNGEKLPLMSIEDFILEVRNACAQEMKQFYPHK
nr:threonine--tRNA ligase [Desulfobacterales bacterium]